MKKKKLLSLLLGMVFLLGMLPASSAKAGYDHPFDGEDDGIFINGTLLTSPDNLVNHEYVLTTGVGDNGKVTYNPDTYTLTLKNTTITSYLNSAVLVNNYDVKVVNVDGSNNWTTDEFLDRNGSGFAFNYTTSAYGSTHQLQDILFTTADGVDDSITMTGYSNGIRFVRNNQSSVTGNFTFDGGLSISMLECSSTGIDTNSSASVTLNDVDFTMTDQGITGVGINIQGAHSLTISQDANVDIHARSCAFLVCSNSITGASGSFTIDDKATLCLRSEEKVIYTDYNVMYGGQNLNEILTKNDTFVKLADGQITEKKSIPRYMTIGSTNLVDDPSVVPVNDVYTKTVGVNSYASYDAKTSVLTLCNYIADEPFSIHYMNADYGLFVNKPISIVLKGTNEITNNAMGVYYSGVLPITGNGTLHVKSSGMAFYTACSVTLDGVGVSTAYPMKEITLSVPYSDPNTPTNTPAPTVTPTASPTPVPTAVPTVKSASTPSPELDKGETATVSAQKYIVTSTKDGSETVSFTGTKSKKVTTVTVPSTVKVNGVTYKVTTVAANAFNGNKKIKKVTLTKNIKTIAKGAFTNCKNLKRITIKSKKITSIHKNAFKNINKKAVIDVPNNMIKYYKKLFKKAGLAKTVRIK